MEQLGRGPVVGQDGPDPDRRPGHRRLGPINVDHIVQTDNQQATAPKEPPLDRWTQYAQVLLGSNEFMFVR
ncbi:MAG: hypothetical protein CM1200mP2_12840 [Planctomycetaceae bacterium]|nr:MAG: hypothetical protein CM1200mP2_12840 [Planctomycetaceae bacterium]